MTIGAGGSCFHVICAPSFVTKSCGVFLLNVAFESPFPLTCSVSWRKRWLNIWHHQISHFFLLLEYPLVWECANWPVGHQQNERMTDHRIHWNTFSQGYFVIKFPHTSIPIFHVNVGLLILNIWPEAGKLAIIWLDWMARKCCTYKPPLPGLMDCFPKEKHLHGPLPWKINMEHSNHPFGKENDLNQTSMIMFHVSLPGCTLQSTNMATEHETFHIYIYISDSLPLNILVILKRI